MRANVAGTSTAPRTAPPSVGARAEMQRDLRAVEKSLAASVGSNGSRIDEAARHELLANGKRVRPLLTCAVMRALRQDPEPCIDMVAAVELAHTASLLHDDLIDGATTRRGIRAAHVAFDVPTAVLAGDCLVMLALERLARGAPPELLVALCTAIRDLCSGESLEREHLNDVGVDLALCRRINRLKTASLFAYAAEAGAILAGAGDRLRRSGRAFGMALGEAFQARDDLLDYRGCSEELGKPIGQDLAGGMVTVPLAIALERDPGLRDDVRGIWSTARDGEPFDKGFHRLQARMARVGALAAARRLGAADAARAEAAIASFPPGPWTDRLRTLPHVMLRRSR